MLISPSRAWKIYHLEHFVTCRAWLGSAGLASGQVLVGLRLASGSVGLSSVLGQALVRLGSWFFPGSSSI